MGCKGSRVQISALRLPKNSAKSSGNSRSARGAIREIFSSGYPRGYRGALSDPGVRLSRLLHPISSPELTVARFDTLDAARAELPVAIAQAMLRLARMQGRERAEEEAQRLCEHSRLRLLPLVRLPEASAPDLAGRLVEVAAILGAWPQGRRTSRRAISLSR